jgi:hypothetical protein
VELHSVEPRREIAPGSIEGSFDALRHEGECRLFEGEGRARVVGEHEDGMMERRLIAPTTRSTGSSYWAACGRE